MKGVSITKMAQALNLKNLTPDIDLEGKYVTLPDINRPALQLTGYFDYFEKSKNGILPMSVLSPAEFPVLFSAR